MFLYLLLGSCGAPIFAWGLGGMARLLGPTGGYLIGFLLGAIFLAAVRTKSTTGTFIKLLGAYLILYACGLARLSFFVGASNLLQAGLFPFVLGDLIKILVMTFVARRTWASKNLLIFFNSHSRCILLCCRCTVLHFDQQWVDISSIEHANPSKPSVVLDDEGKVLFSFAIDKREWVSFDKFRHWLWKLLLQQRIINFLNMAVYHCVHAPFIHYQYSTTQGGAGASTITQQLVKLLFLSYDRTFLRKAKEVFLALQLERQLTKEQILETYLNHIYLAVVFMG